MEPFTSMVDLRKTLEGSKPDVYAVRGMMDARLASDEVVRTLLLDPLSRPPTLGDLTARVAEAESKLSPVEPEAVYTLGEELGYTVQICWQPENPVLFDALFVKQGGKQPVSLVTATYKTALRKEKHRRRPAALGASSWEEMTNKGGRYGPQGANNTLTAADVGQIRSDMRKTLPEYMIPSVFVSLPALPKTQNGKVDRKQLPDPSPTDLEVSGQRDTPFEPPTGEMEETLAGLWQDLLMTPEVSATDCFFSLGGHSLLAMQLVHEVKQITGLQLKLAEIVEHSVLRDLARCSLCRPEVPLRA